ncbi:MAG: hypothetical protein IAF38_19395 [Bacteroidia bacterium]|nr:hypothetical protein [Bacteroidia bacterium]
MNKKYPDNYFAHFLEMLAVNYSDKKGRIDLTEENVNDLILLLVFTEGEEKFQELKKELNQIVENKDLPKFKTKEIKEPKQLEFIAEVVLKHR